MDRTISIIEAEIFIEALKNKKISHVWRGYGSAIFLEVGELKRNTKSNNPEGECCIAIEGSWRIENKKSIILGSWSENEEIDDVTSILIDREIKNISFFSRLKEIELELNHEYWLLSFATEKGNPEWSIKNNNEWLSYQNGEFVIEKITHLGKV